LCGEPCAARLIYLDGNIMGEKLKRRRNFSWWRVIVLGLVVCGAAMWFFERVAGLRKEIRHIVLISMDTCRADSLSCYGYPGRTTPNIDAVAEEAIVFNHVLTPIALTLPAHSSMLTGTTPLYHGVHHNLGYRLEESSVTVGEVLQREGYSTGAIVSTYVLDSEFGLNQGFDSYDDEFVEPIPVFYHNERKGGEASRVACEWLERHQDERFFLFLHYYDPHSPYEPPEPFASTFAGRPYAGEVAYTDYCIGQVIKKLKELNLYDSTLLIITSDHGEGFGEHREREHGYYIYQSTVHVPLVIKVPGGAEGKRVNETAGLVDIVPTICGVLGITPPSTIHGVDLSRFLKRRGDIEKTDRYIYCESFLPTRYDCPPLLGVVNYPWKYIQAPRQELYDLNQGPREEENLFSKDPKRARLLQEHLKLIIEEQVRTEEAEDKFVLSAESRRRLESLGYVAAGSTDVDFEFDSSKNDPKDFNLLHKQVMSAWVFIKRQQYSEAEAMCNKMVAEHPDYILNFYLLGGIAMGRNNIAESVKHYSKFLSRVEEEKARRPEDESLGYLEAYVSWAHLRLGIAFSAQERLEDAISQYSEALKMDPEMAEAYFNLGHAYRRQGKLSEAIEHYSRALELDPEFAEAHYSLGNIMLEREEFEKAIIYYRKALELRPDWSQASGALQAAQSRKKEREEATDPWLQRDF